MPEKKVLPKANFDKACSHYKDFIDKYSVSVPYKGRTYKHSVPSSWVYNVIKDNCIWLLTLVVGVAGYSVFFDDDTEASKVISKKMLDAAGVKDPALQYDSKIEPWTGQVSLGKTPYAPVDKITTGVGIAHFNSSGLSHFYKGEPLSAKLPKIDPETGAIVKTDDGKIVSETCNIFFDNKQVYGWGMSYQKGGKDKRLPLSCVSDYLSSLNYCNGTNGLCCLKCLKEIGAWNLIGPDYGKPYEKSRYMNKEEATSFIDWCDYHLKRDPDMFYPALAWMSKYWAPALSWEGGNSIQFCMYWAGYTNSGFKNATSYFGKSIEALTEGYIKTGRSHPEHRIANLQRAVSLLEFIKRV